PRVINPGLPLCLETLILKMLAKDPEKRIQSAQDIVAAIQRMEAGIAHGSIPMEAPSSAGPQEYPQRHGCLITTPTKTHFAITAASSTRERAKRQVVIGLATTVILILAAGVIVRGRNERNGHLEEGAVDAAKKQPK